MKFWWIWKVQLDEEQVDTSRTENHFFFFMKFQTKEFLHGMDSIFQYFQLKNFIPRYFTENPASFPTLNFNTAN